MKVAALIVAAGRGTRLNSSTPKQYLSIDGISLLERSIIAFKDIVDFIQVVIHPDDILLYQPIADKYNLLAHCYGGALRQDSVRFGLEALEKVAPNKVLIHDAARPFVAASVIKAIITELDNKKAVIAANPAIDTIKKVHNLKVIETLNRDELIQVQTPQGFDFALINQLHHQLTVNVTDDAAVAEHFGIDVYVVKSPNDNIKITHLEDIKMNFETRIGTGFDAHKFCPAKSAQDNFIYLCGVKVPFEKSIDAHSDGDVALHALVDAMLGSIAAGDIGMHFPPSDIKWKNADSTIFVKHAHDLIKLQHGQIINIDLTIIGEEPRIGKYRDLMQKSIADLLDLNISRVNIKATTTEKMGFTGRKEGLAVQAAIGVKLPC